MAELGILQRLIPELGEAYRRVPFDAVHRHTIGHHSVETVRALEALRSTPDPRLQEFRRIWSEAHAPHLLYLAALLHDVGKILPGGGHAASGARLAREVCERFRLDPPSAGCVETLVLHHLLMSETAQLRDLTLDKTIQDFTAIVDSAPVLNMLMLLTCADMEATGVLSPMKIRFLEDLYFRAEPVVSGDSAARPVSPERTTLFRSRLSRRLAAANLTPEQIEQHTAGMPVSYLLNTRPELIALHIRMIDALPGGPVVEFDNEMGADITTIHLCTRERPEPGLLSQVAGTLYAHEISVHGAQVFTRQGDPPIALDTLWVDQHGRAIAPLKRLELEQDLISTLKAGDVDSLIARYRKQLAPASPPHRIRFDNDLAESHTVIEMEAQDQPALLYRTTRTMAALGWNIHSARISTRGDIARDAFYVTDENGEKLLGDPAHLSEVFLARFLE
jgi:[protein-PII] uridylyltransferase